MPQISPLRTLIRPLRPQISPLMHQTQLIQTLSALLDFNQPSYELSHERIKVPLRSTVLRPAAPSKIVQSKATGIANLLLLFIVATS